MVLWISEGIRIPATSPNEETSVCFACTVFIKIDEFGFFSVCDDPSQAPIRSRFKLYLAEVEKSLSLHLRPVSTCFPTNGSTNLVYCVQKERFDKDVYERWANQLRLCSFEWDSLGVILGIGF